MKSAVVTNEGEKSGEIFPNWKYLTQYSKCDICDFAALIGLDVHFLQKQTDYRAYHHRHPACRHRANS
jgi:hypothetical protein